MKGKTSAQKISAHFDNDWKNARSTIRTRTNDSQTYDPVTSWEARTDDPNRFSRLQATYMPSQPVKPIVLSGHAVIPLEGGTGLDVLNVRQPAVAISAIPLTQEQRDVGMNPDLTGQVQMLHTAAQSNKIIVMKEPPGYKNMDVRPVSFQQVDYPRSLLESGPQCDQKVAVCMHSTWSLLFFF